MQTLDIKDYIVFFCYFVLIVGYGIWIYNQRRKRYPTVKITF